MIRMRALWHFKCMYLKGLKKGLPSEQSADKAMEETKGYIRSLLDQDPNLTNEGREVRWGLILRDLVDWQVLLVAIPIDHSRVDESTGECLNCDPLIPAEEDPSSWPTTTTPPE